MPAMPAKHRPPGYAEPSAVRRQQDAYRPSAAKRGYDRAWQTFRRWFAARVPPVCVWPMPGGATCGKAGTSKTMHLDHIVAMAKGGKRLDPNNVQWLCHTHHSEKTVKEDGGLGHA